MFENIGSAEDEGRKLDELLAKQREAQAMRDKCWSAIAMSMRHSPHEVQQRIKETFGDEAATIADVHRRHREARQTLAKLVSPIDVAQRRVEKAAALVERRSAPIRG